MHGSHSLFNARHNFYIVLPVLHGDYGKEAWPRFSAYDLQTFLARGAMRDCYVAAELLIDFVHHLPESLSVGTGVLQLVVGNIVMNHLMVERVLQFCFGEVKLPADAERKIGEVLFAKQPYPLTAGHLSHIRTRVR